MESDAHEWLEREDEAARPERQERLCWIVDHYPAAEGFVLSGGWLSKQLLEEAKYSFVYGQSVAAATLGVAFVERILASQSYAAGRDDLERAGGHELLAEAVRCRWLTQEDFHCFRSDARASESSRALQAAVGSRYDRSSRCGQ